ncbi:MAG: uroporphyrinogen decarboxylase family protein [Candidatus Latescibacteria bacterium]|jgi:hypothetical protein|nr:uroporphyrinogen decarboxylase family protein [Candidatus Latescibacterota bacterium]
MTPNERLLAAVSGQETDRIPVVPKIWVDLAAQLASTGLKQVIEEPITALSVIADVGLDLDVDAVRQFHFPSRATVEEGGIVYEVNQRGRKLGPIDIAGGLSTKLFDGADFDSYDPKVMAYHNHWHPPEPAVKNLADAAQIAVPDSSIFDELGWADRQAVVARRVGEKLALIADLGSATMAFHVSMRGDMQTALLDIIDQPEMVHAVMEKGVAIAIAKGRYWLDHGMKTLRLNDSVGNMSVLSPEHWKRFVYPHMKTVCDQLHSYDSDAKIYCHICGNILPILGLLVDTGVDCIGPLDPLGGMKITDVRDAVGCDVALMGGVDTQSFVNSTAAEIAAEARRCIRDAGVGGGFVLGSGCVIPRIARRENLAALVEAAHQEAA